MQTWTQTFPQKNLTQNSPAPKFHFKMCLMRYLSLGHLKGVQMLKLLLYAGKEETKMPAWKKTLILYLTGMIFF